MPQMATDRLLAQFVRGEAVQYCRSRGLLRAAAADSPSGRGSQEGTCRRLRPFEDCSVVEEAATKAAAVENTGFGSD